MSDIVDIVRAQRPDRPVLDAATRSKLRSRVSGAADTGVAVASGPDPARSSVPGPARDRRTRGLLVVAASVLTLAGVVGVWASANRPGEQTHTPPEQPTSAPSSESTAPIERVDGDTGVPGGAVILDEFPDALTEATGYSYVGTAEASQPAGPVEPWIQRWYTATMDQPELHPRLQLASTSATQQFAPAVPPADVEPTQVTVGGETAWLYDDPSGSGRAVAFRDDDTLFVVTGYQLSDDDLLTAAEHTVLADNDSVGAVIDPAALPEGLVERAVGTVSEERFTPLESLQSAPASIRWYNARPDGALPSDGEPMLWLGWRREDPGLLPLHRLDYDNVTDTTVRGVPAFIASNDTPGYLAILWSEGGYRYTLGGFGLNQRTVLEAANQMQPATAEDWAALKPEPS